MTSPTLQLRTNLNLIKADRASGGNRVFSDIFRQGHYRPERTISVAITKYPELKMLNKEKVGIDFGDYTLHVEDGVPEVVQIGAYDRNGEFLIGSHGFKENDKTPRDDPSRIPLNEMTWQLFAHTARQNAGKLKVMVVQNVQNKGTWEIVRKEYAPKNPPLSRRAIWKHDPNDATTTPNWFNTYLGSDNIAGKIFTLKNHHRILGNKKFTKILLTYPSQVKDSSNQLTMVVLLE
ncbi:hypothetical protein AJ79_02579 [Helicocarpus griseus UAMH5409]|uniref:Uncharacterized protein n=1 Tax=Helicocarpus griseus UAMH5409 TaxID=1447875 RepID=A0A2B7XTW8_9EURO|nr:hypothetical protein AJ79_02579 [Helicocarpus griseus UAMH5409]